MATEGRVTRNDGKDFLVWRVGSGNTVEIVDIVVNSNRRRGVGREMIYEFYCIPNRPKLFWAITRADNFIAQQFYEALKWRVVGVLRYFYQDGAETVDAIMYGKDNDESR